MFSIKVISKIVERERETDRDRQTDRQTYRQRQRQRERERQREQYMTRTYTILMGDVVGIGRKNVDGFLVCFIRQHGHLGSVEVGIQD